MAMLRRADNEGLYAEAPTWKIYTALGLSLTGLGISIYLTIVHFVGTQLLACSTNSVINCTKVTTSAESWFPPTSSLHPGFVHIPVAILGLGYYVVMVALNTPWAWRSEDRRVHLARLALLGAGMAFALYLISAELVIIGNICEWCTGVHIVTFFLFIVVVSAVPAMIGLGQRPEYEDA
jgi:uncharacterized membrane protein